MLALGLGACASPDDESASGQSSSSVDVEVPDEAAEPSQVTFDDGVLETSEVRIEITDYKVLPVGSKGNDYGEKPVIAVWYDITNISGDDVDPLQFIFLFTAYQDNNPDSLNELQVGGLPDDRFLDSQTEKIKKGGTVENAIAYELDDVTTPVDLLASDELAGDEVGRMTFKLKR